MNKVAIIFFLTLVNAQFVEKIDFVNNSSSSNYLHQNSYFSDRYISIENKFEFRNSTLTLTPHLDSNGAHLNQFLFSFKNNFGDFNFGKFHNDQYNENLLSTGHLIQSKNANPYLNISFLKNFNITKSFQIQYFQSEGILEKNNIYFEAPYIHNKRLHFIYSKNQNNFSFGMNHVAIWGGHVKNFGKLPNSLNDYFRVFTGGSGDDNAPITEQVNALGDAWGIYDFNYKRILPQFDISLYYQHIFADRSGMKFLNSYDGLFGILVENNRNVLKQKYLFEYLNTVDQGGDFHPPGGDAYYWNGIYSSGWTFKDDIIGNPYIEVFNNRVEMISLALLLEKNKFNVIINLAKSNQYKSYNNRLYTDIEYVDNGFYYVLGDDIIINSYEVINVIFSQKMTEQLSLSLGLSHISGNSLESLLRITYNFR